MTEKPISHTNDNDLSHSMVHYLLTIHKLKEEKGYARVTDIAKDLQITKGSVSTALNNLKKKELVFEEEDSKFMNLTTEGHQEVHKVLTSRTLLFYFLKDFVGVSEKVSHKDSCLMEHLMSDETRDKFFNFMKTLTTSCECKKPGSNETYKFQTALDFSSYENAEHFKTIQEGDKYLKIDS